MGKPKPRPVSAGCLPNTTTPTARMPINWLYSWTADLVRLKHHNEKYLKNNDLKDTLHMLSEQVDLKGLYLLLDKLQQARRLIETQVNQQLMWEDVLIMWSRLFPANAR